MNNRDRAEWRWNLWAKFAFLPAGPYYLLGDVLVGLGGWRPLSYRMKETK